MVVELACLQLALFDIISRALHGTPRLGVDGAGSGHRARFFHGLLDVVGGDKVDCERQGVVCK